MKKCKPLPVRVIAENDYLCAYLREQIRTCTGLSICEDDQEERALILAESTLSPAEKRVLNAFVKHDKVSDVAKTLCLSEHTVKKHLENIYRKLGVHSLHRALLLSFRAGWLDNKPED